MIGMVGTVKSNIANASHRTLPPSSPYQRIKDVFQWRLTFSQNNATIPTEALAKQMVAKALAYEAPGFLRSLLGRPDWFWGGGMSTTVWLGTWIGEWFSDMVCYGKFRLPQLEAILRREAAQKKLK